MTIANSFEKNNRSYFLYYLVISTLLSLCVVFTIQIVTNPVLTLIISSGLILLFIAASRILCMNVHAACIFLIGFAVLAPPIELIGSLPKFRPEELLIYGVIPLALFYNTSKPRKNIRPLINIFIILFAFIFCSIIYSYSIIGIEFSLRDVTELAQVVKYILVILFVSSVSWTDENIKKLINYFLIFLSISCVIGILQSVANEALSFIGQYYTDPDRQIEIFNSQRISGTFGGPNQFSLILFFGLILCLNSLSLKLRIKGMILVMLFAITLVLTGSRTAISASVFALAIYLLLHAFKRRGFSKKLVVTSLIIISLLLTIPYVRYLFDFSQIIFNPMADMSFANRYNGGLDQAIFYFKQSPIFGIGPAKGQIIGVQDSQYYYFLSRYGLLGIMWLFLYYLYPIKYALNKGLRLLPNNYSTVLYDSVLILIPSFFVFNITSVTFSTIQFMDVWIPFLTIFFCCEVEKRRLR